QTNRYHRRGMFTIPTRERRPIRLGTATKTLRRKTSALCLVSGRANERRRGLPIKRSRVGQPTADGSVIMDWALADDGVVFTHHFDFGTMLALIHATGPGVLQALASWTRSALPW